MKHPETDLQIAVGKYLRLQYPNALWIHVPNERKTNIRFNKQGRAYSPMGNLLSKMGVKKGAPDILIFEQNNVFNGLAIELKIEPNKPTPDQLNFLFALTIRKWDACICYSFDTAKNVIDKYFK